MNDLLTNPWVWIILAIIFIIIAVIIYHASHGYTGWYWLFIVLTVISVILAFVAYTRHREAAAFVNEVKSAGMQGAYRAGLSPRPAYY